MCYVAYNSSYLQDLGDGLMNLCLTAVNHWKMSELEASHLGRLYV